MARLKTITTGPPTTGATTKTGGGKTRLQSNAKRRLSMGGKGG